MNIIASGIILPQIAVPSRRDGLSQPQRPADAVLDRQKQTQDAITQEAQGDGENRRHSIQPVVVRSGDDHAEHEQRVDDREGDVQDLLQVGPARGSAGEALQQAGVVEECASNDEGVGEVQTGHGGELVNGLAAHPDALGVLLTHGIEESVRLGQQTGWHAGVDAEDDERGEVAQRHGSTGDGEGVVVLGGVIVPGEEAIEVITRCQLATVGFNRDRESAIRLTARSPGYARASRCG